MKTFVKKKSGSSRREFITGSLSAGAALAFAGLIQSRGENINMSKNDMRKVLGDFGIPLVTQRIPQPDNGNCLLACFSPVNDRTAFVCGAGDKRSLYISRPGKTDSFDLFWEPTGEYCIIRAISWSPNGREIALLVQTDNVTATYQYKHFSIYIVDVVSGAAREPIIIKESIGETILDGDVYRNHFSWRGDTFVCVTADDGSVLKFDKSTGMSDMLIPSQDGVLITSIALTKSGELRFIKSKKLEASNYKEYNIAGLAQDGSVRDYGNLSEQFGEIFGVGLSPQGDFVFFQKHGVSPKSLQAFLPVTHCIYKIETRSIAGRIPAVVNYEGDIYSDMYMPLFVQNDNELILMEAVSQEKDGGAIVNLERIVKTALSPEKQYTIGEM